MVDGRTHANDEAFFNANPAYTRVLRSRGVAIPRQIYLQVFGQHGSVPCHFCVYDVCLWLFC